jgi:general secretion pathway protein L
VLGLAAAITPFITQSLALGTVERQIAALQPQIAQVQTFRRQLASGSASADVIATERARIGNTLQVLATVTDLMPDDTVLSEFTLRQGKLGISGQSHAAARLIPALAADPLIRNPAFVAPVTRAPAAAPRSGQVETEQVDSFSIRAELNP